MESRTQFRIHAALAKVKADPGEDEDTHLWQSLLAEFHTKGLLTWVPVPAVSSFRLLRDYTNVWKVC